MSGEKIRKIMIKENHNRYLERIKMKTTNGVLDFSPKELYEEEGVF